MNHFALSAVCTTLLVATSLAQTPDWIQMTPASPADRLEHAMAYDSVRGKVIMFGGYDGSHLNGTWEYDGVNWTYVTTASRPSARSGHRMA